MVGGPRARGGVADLEPQTSCVYAFEPNRRWTERLRQVELEIRPKVAKIDVHTEKKSTTCRISLTVSCCAVLPSPPRP